jgi:hypothetical protein
MSQTLVETPTSAAATRVRYVVLAWFCSLSMITYIDSVCIKKLSQYLSSGLKAMKSSEPQESAGQLQQPEVVLPVLVVPHQQRAALG